MNAAKQAFSKAPKMPAGGGGAIVALVGVVAGGYAISNSVVTGGKLFLRRSISSLFFCLLSFMIK
jgi:formiminotetrahydrofolate cyclodeaminase